MLRFAVVLLVAVAAFSSASGGEQTNCAAKSLVLWGDGKHDDTGALNAWFRGDPVVWAESGRSVGAQISGRVFRLSSTIYISSGSGRRIDSFQFVWPERNELVSGGTIVAGTDPDQEPVAIGLTKIGAGPNEGVPFHIPNPKSGTPDDHSGCLVS